MYNKIKHLLRICLFIFFLQCIIIYKINSWIHVVMYDDMYDKY